MRKVAGHVGSESGTPSVSSHHVDAMMRRAEEARDRGDLIGCEMQLQEVLRLEPGHSVALNTLGNIALAAHRHEAAVEWHRRAAKSAPRDAGILNDLANSLIQAGDPQAALIPLRKSLERNPMLRPALLNQARAYRALRKPERALAILERLAPLAGVDVDADLERAVTLSQIGRSADALELFRSVLTMRPADARALDGVSTCHRATTADNDLAAVEFALDQFGLTPAQRAVANRAAGKILEDLGRYDEAFTRFREANTAMDRSFDIGRHRAFVAGSLRLFTKHFFADRTSFGDPSERPVFVVGMPRSGSTLVEQILAAHPAVAALGERPDIERGLAQAIPRAWGSPAFFQSIEDVSSRTLRDQARQYLAATSVRESKAVRFVDKMPHNFLVLGWIALLFPKARVIHCHRDPMDLCLSCYTHHFADAHSYSSDLRTLGQYYRAYEALMRHWHEVLPLAILDVPYEALVGDLEGQSRKMVTHLGLDWNAACLAYRERRSIVQTPSRWQVRQPIYTSSIGRWRRFEKHLQPLVEGLEASPT